MRKAKNIKLIGVSVIIILIMWGVSGCSGNSSEKSERYGVNIQKKELLAQKTFLLIQINILVKQSDWRGRLSENAPQDVGSF